MNADLSKPNPNYVDAPFEEARWTPQTGKLLMREVSRDEHGMWIEGTDENGVKHRERKITPIFKHQYWNGESKT